MDSELGGIQGKEGVEKGEAGFWTKPRQVPRVPHSLTPPLSRSAPFLFRHCPTVPAFLIPSHRRDLTVPALPFPSHTAAVPQNPARAPRCHCPHAAAVPQCPALPLPSRRRCPAVPRAAIALTPPLSRSAPRSSFPHTAAIPQCPAFLILFRHSPTVPHAAIALTPTVPRSCSVTVPTVPRSCSVTVPTVPRVPHPVPAQSHTVPRSSSSSGAIPQCPTLPLPSRRRRPAVPAFLIPSHRRCPAVPAFLIPLTPPLSRSARVPHPLTPPPSRSARGPAQPWRTRGQGQKVQKVMVQPINLIFRYLQNRSRIQVWLYEQVNMRIEGCIIVSAPLGFGVTPKSASSRP
ncbi:uncharacterized protein LOC128818503 [Vidua macroura]|uniref:uncharacterized protein LOC128818503 n=1 Tax=Vidua macroura TaxID=187451 RepID=UPI0023A806F5|nr:uncharacterized protein LOC128818503 [Vidua macroura]